MFGINITDKDDNNLHFTFDKQIFMTLETKHKMFAIGLHWEYCIYKESECSKVIKTNKL